MIRFPSCALSLFACWFTVFSAKAEVVDTHVHLWHLDRPDGIYWIKKDNETLYRTFMPEHHEPLAKAAGVDGVVIVQAGQHLPDNQWNLDATAHNKALYRGVVGNLSKVIGTDAFRPLFDQLSKDERYVGYRLSGRAEGQPMDGAFFRDLKLTAERGKTVDVLVGGYSLEDVAVIAKRVPELKIILDHFGNVVLDGEPLDPEWVEAFRATAAHPNVYCKVSALFGRVKKQPAPKEVAFYQPVAKLALDAFGEDRLVFGSDWPVTRTSGDYREVIELTRGLFPAAGEAFSDKLLGANAKRFYGLVEPKLSRVDAALERLKLPGVKIDLEQRCVDIEATICLDAGSLELIACTKGTKEHESIVVTDAKAMHIHTALLLLGAKAGNPAISQRAKDGSGWVDLAPAGAEVNVLLVFENGAGERVERPVGEFIAPVEGREIDLENGKFPSTPFLFAGSRLHDNGAGKRTYVADASGNLISLSTFGDELLCLPGTHAHENGQLLWEVDTKRIPPVDTKVVLRVRVAPLKAE